MKEIKIAYIGGGSRLWARSLMSDLALVKDLKGEVRLYDIDVEAAERNAVIGNKIMALENANHAFKFIVSNTLEEALTDVDFVFISILPGTLDDMEKYVHIPQKYDIYQTVGDTTGPSGIFRALIMMPMYEVIAKAIQKICPNAWVLNFTNPMTMCVQTLYHIFPEIKAFGNCHEIFFVQRILARALKEETGIDTPFNTIQINPIGINHFTWINYASYQDIDIMPIYERFVNRYHSVGLLPDEEWKNVGPFGSAERVKLDLYKKTGVIAAAGDRHLVEFLPHDWYLKNKETIDYWRFHLTPVQKRKEIMKYGDDTAKKIVAGEMDVHLSPSGEEGISQVQAIVGQKTLVTNVNMPNRGQIPNLPLGHVVETNAYFRKDSVQPIQSGDMPPFPLNYTLQHLKVHDLLFKSFDEKSLKFALEAFHLDVSLQSLSHDKREAMFKELVDALKPALTYYKN